MCLRSIWRSGLRSRIRPTNGHGCCALQSINAGRISDERFAELSADYEAEQRQLKERAAELQGELSKAQEATVNAAEGKQPVGAVPLSQRKDALLLGFAG